MPCWLLSAFQLLEAKGGRDTLGSGFSGASYKAHSAVLSGGHEGEWGGQEWEGHEGEWGHPWIFFPPCHTEEEHPVPGQSLTGLPSVVVCF